VRLTLHVSVHNYDHLQGAVSSTDSMTRSHPDRSSRHTYKLTVMTYGHTLYKNITNVHQQNST